MFWLHLPDYLRIRNLAIGGREQGLTDRSMGDMASGRN
jgi:hypothetical protein